MDQDQQYMAGTCGSSGPSRMAGVIALLRYAESRLPEDTRIFSDPYAVLFVDPAFIAWAKSHPEKAQARVKHIEEMAPDWNDAIRIRIRYFDDVAQDAAREGFSQVLLLGAGYDTRALRIDALRHGMRIFEVDLPGTLEHKAAILRQAAVQIPGNVTEVPCDMGLTSCWPALEHAGFSQREKTLILLEGLVMYLPRPAVERLLAGIACHTGAGSVVLFDYVPASLAEGSLEEEGAQNIRTSTVRIREPIISGFSDTELAPFLESLRYTGVKMVAARTCGAIYFTGRNSARKVSGLLAFASATIQGDVQ